MARDIRNDNDERLLAFTLKHDVTLVKTFVSIPQTCISHTFNRVGNRRRIDDILTRQRNRILARNVVVDPKPLFHPCETARQICFQPPGRKGYKLHPQPAEADGGFKFPE